MLGQERMVLWTHSICLMFVRSIFYIHLCAHVISGFDVLIVLFTCSRTLAVSRGKVSRSAMQAAVPAPTNFTAADGGTSAGPNPTIFQNYFDQYKD